ncbi:MAG TPA: isochorismatase family cysteine hydrolase [Nitrospiraceae bacterium]|nr:isochorismatase family cysteine hydrolase [Nitrospiraceae bacterium]
MPAPNSDLHGSAPDAADTCLLIIDMINTFDFEDADKFFPAALHTAERIARLKERVTALGIPTIYVNDNFGKWRNDFRKLLDYCLTSRCRGQSIAQILRPHEDDYFVLKPKHSGFFATPLELLLKFLGTRRLILTGMAGDNCVLHTAADAYMRDFAICVPSDCTVSLDPESNDSALGNMKATLKADISISSAIRLDKNVAGLAS